MDYVQLYSIFCEYANPPPPPHFLVESLVSVSAYSNMNFHAPKKWAAILFHPEGCIYLRQVLNCSISHGRRVYCWTPGGGELIAVEVSFPFHHFLSGANEQGATCPQNLIGKICWISIVDFSSHIFWDLSLSLSSPIDFTKLVPCPQTTSKMWKRANCKGSVSHLWHPFPFIASPNFHWSPVQF